MQNRTEIENTEIKARNGLRLGRLCIGVSLVVGLLVLFCISLLWFGSQENQRAVREITSLWLLAILAAVIFFAVIVYRQVVKVLAGYQDSIAENRRLEEDGVRELRLLARLHNDSFEQTRERERSLRSKADHDVLTGLFNRGGFEVLFEKLVHSGAGQGAFMIMDLDNFKHINDTYGHETGDQALKYVANILKESFRAGDLVGRYGGDEFITWMPGISENHAEFVSNRVCSLNQKLSLASGKLPPMSISAGVIITGKQMEFTDVFRKADKALYYVKEHGRKGCCIYDRDEVIR